MNRADRARHPDGDVQELQQRRALVAKLRLEGDVTQVLEDQRHAASMGNERERANDLGQVQRRQQRVLVPEPGDLGGGRVLAPKHLHDDPHAVGVPRPPQQQAALRLADDVG